jgi:hypothetical protein
MIEQDSREWTGARWLVQNPVQRQFAARKRYDLCAGEDQRK